MKSLEFKDEDGFSVFAHYYSNLSGDVTFNIPARRVGEPYQNDGRPWVGVEIPGKLLKVLVAEIVRNQRVDRLEHADDNEILGLRSTEEAP